MEMYGTEYEQGETCERGYAFFSRAWKEMEFHCVKLEEVCRQKDAEFLGILNDIKYGRNLQNVIAWKRLLILLERMQRQIKSIRHT